MVGLSEEENSFEVLRLQEVSCLVFISLAHLRPVPQKAPQNMHTHTNASSQKNSQTVFVTQMPF